MHLLNTALPLLVATAASLAPLPPQPPDTPWPTEDWPGTPGVSPTFDASQLEAAVAEAFRDPEPSRPVRTRAVLVVHRGRLAAELTLPASTLARASRPGR
jgi:hypothetical protein